MNQYYLVKYSSNWADEFYVEGFALLTEESKEFFSSLTQDDFPLIHHVGTNEDIEYEKVSDLLQCYTWTSIGSMEYQVIKKYIGEEYGHFYYPEVIEKDEDE